jgi:hypothetical protein
MNAPEWPTMLSVAIGVPMLIAKGVDVTWSIGPLGTIVARMLWSAGLASDRRRDRAGREATRSPRSPDR